MGQKKIADFKDVADLTPFTADDLRSAIEDGYATLDPILDEESPTAAQVVQAREVHAEIKRLEQRLSDIEAEDAELAKELEAMRTERSAQRPPEASTEDEKPETDEVVEEAEAEAEDTDTTQDQPEEVTAEETTEETDDESEVVAEIDGETGEVTEIVPDTPAEIVDTETEQVTPERELVTAASQRRIAGRRPVAPPKEIKVDRPKVNIRAALDTGLRPSGEGLTDLKDVADIAVHRLGQLRGASGNQSFGIASFERPVEEGFVITDTMSDIEMDDILNRVSDEKRLEGGALTAATAGWCAPLETIWDICDGGTTDGLWDIPGLRVSRGGVRYLKAVDYSALYAANATPGTTAAGWYYTQAQVVAGTKKVCIEVPCPAFTDLVLDAAGICVTSPLLTATAFPEWVRKFVAEAMIAHEVLMAKQLLAKAITAAGTALDATDAKSTAASTLDAIELIIEERRQKYRWGQQTLEVVLPHWVRGAIRADLANRGGVDLLGVTDAQINNWFAIRHARPQFVFGLDDLTDNAVVYPNKFRALIYRAGTFVKLFQPIINLGIQYDSSLLEVNKRTEMFTEEGVALMEKCYGATLVNIPVCSSGHTGAPDTDECYAAP